MGIAVLDLAASEKAAHLDQFVDDGLVGGAFAALAAEDVVAAEEGQVFRGRAVVHHVVGDDLGSMFSRGKARIPPSRGRGRSGRSRCLLHR